MRRLTNLARFMVALLFGFAALGTGWAQATGSIVGTVTDTAGAVVPGASVATTNLGTNQTTTIQSDAAGDFQFTHLLPGNYKVVVQHPGFQQSVVQPVEVTVGTAARVAAALQVGALTQTVEVTSLSPLLQTQTSALNYEVGTRQVQQLPLNGRNVLNLMELVPGVVPQGNTTGNAATDNVNGWGNYQIGGGTANQSATYIDGAPINISYGNSTALVPTQEAIQEFQVSTNNVSSEYGRFAGGVVNMATKSGTNAFHGVLYEYVRNAALNANLFFNNRAGIARPVYTQNQYGATVGGPIVKDKAFFFLSWEQFDLDQATSTLTTVPTPQMVQGDFSQLLPSTQLYNPLTNNGSGQRSPYPRNQIQAYLNPTAKILAPLLWPSPTNPNVLVNNFQVNVPKITDYNQYTARVDDQLNSKNKLFARFTDWHKNEAASSALQNDTGNRSYFATDQAVVGDTITLSPTWVAEGRASFLRFVDRSLPLTCCDFNFSQLGTGWAQYQTESTFPQLPQPNVAGLYNFATGATILDTDNAYVLSGNITAILGRHQIVFGGESRKIEWDYVQSNSPGGTFTFSNGFTSSSIGGTGGYGFAEFMLGYPESGSAQEPKLSKGVEWYSGAFINDSFRYTPKLTINAGLRWEQPGSFTETHGALTTLDLGLPQPAVSAALGKTVTGGLALINSPQYPHNDWQTLHWLLFSPRIGFAYSPSNNWVVRGGFGISYLPNTVAFSLGPYNNPPNSAVTTMTASLDGGQTPYNTLSNPFPSGIQAPPGRSQAYINSLLGQGIQSPLPTQSYPYEEQWNIQVQHEFADGWVVNAGYVGSNGVHLPLYSTNQDQLPDQYDSMGSALQKQVPNPLYGLVPASAGILGQPTVGQGYLLKPYPQYLYMTADSPSVGGTTYEALQLMAEQRFKSGSVLQFSYTRASLYGTADTLASYLEANRFDVGGGSGVQDNDNIKGEYSQSSFNVPNRLVVNYVATLPFGHGQRYLSHANSFVNQLVSNWAVNGISTFQSGFPLAFQDSVPNTLETYFAAGNAGPGLLAGVTRPNFVAGCHPQMSGKPSTKLTEYFNTACFQVPGPYQFGNEPRVDPNLRAQGIDNSDFSAVKGIPIGERYRMDFRVEIFNIFNWTQFDPPSTEADTGAEFGQVTAQYNQPRLIQLSGRFSF